jgi:Holliday junction resolvasome RuvABC endonuclease subunit
MKDFIGIDLSLNHFGIAFRNGASSTHISLGYSSSKRKFIKNIPGVYVFTSVSKKKGEDDDSFQARRREQVFSTITYFLEHRESSSSEWFVGLEDYAYTTRTNSSHQLAELVGTVKHYLWSKGYQLLLIDPASLKLWATGKGNAYKKNMIESAKKLMTGILPKVTILDDLTLSEERKVNRSYTGTVVDLDGPITDMADAINLSYLVSQKVYLDRKILSFADLPEHQKKVYTKVTKSNPVRLLDLPFIYEG